MNKYRLIEKRIEKHFREYKQALILLGARQVGKTTLLKKVFPDALYLLVDEKPIFDILETYSSANYKKLIKNNKTVFIDELHLLTNPGRAVKILYDQFEGIRLVITGSSSLHIRNKTSESMAGRAINYTLHPLTFSEYNYQMGIDDQLNSVVDKIKNLDQTDSIVTFDLKDVLDEVLIYGQYPEIININNKKEYLKNLAEKAIFKDILELNLIEDQAKALDLLKALAYQIGNVINYSELGRKIKLSTPTVQRYIEIFEQSFILYRLNPFSKSKRDEIGKSPKVFFWDIGLRNALINNFDNIEYRNDSGALFENFVISEVKKEIEYYQLDYLVNYWRVKRGTEVDLVLSDKDEIIGTEIKMTKGSIARAFMNRYPDAKKHIVTASNFY